MRTDHRSRPYRFAKSVLATTALTGFLLFTGTPHARADEAECQHRTIKADQKLHDAVAHHGWDSKEAEHARHDLQEAREYCWKNYHRWWDEDAHRWHTDRDWDDDHGHPH